MHSVRPCMKTSVRANTFMLYFGTFFIGFAISNMAIDALKGNLSTDRNSLLTSAVLLIIGIATVLWAAVASKGSKVSSLLYFAALFFAYLSGFSFMQLLLKSDVRFPLAVFCMVSMAVCIIFSYIGKINNAFEDFESKE